jgi:hypothetical protein
MAAPADDDPLSFADLDLADGSADGVGGVDGGQEPLAEAPVFAAPEPAPPAAAPPAEEPPPPYESVVMESGAGSSVHPVSDGAGGGPTRAPPSKTKNESPSARSAFQSGGSACALSLAHTHTHFTRTQDLVAPAVAPPAVHVSVGCGMCGRE